MKNLEKQVERWHKTIEDLNSQRTKSARIVDDLRTKKRPLTLSAHTGDDKAREELDRLNKELLTAIQGLEDIEEALRQAEEKLAESERDIAEAHEAERLRVLSELAEQRVNVAAEIDKQLHALADHLAQFHGVGIEIRRHLLSTEDVASRKLDAGGRLDLVFGRIIGEFVPSVRMGRNSIDPRKDENLADLERDALSRLLIKPEAAEKLAKRRAA